MGAIKWHKSFWAQLATPLEVRDLANAMLIFVLFRVGLTCGVYFLVMAPFGVFATWWGPVLAWFVTLLVGMAFGTLDLRVQRPRAGARELRPDLPPRPDPACSCSPARSSRSPTSARSGRGSRAAPRCGTASNLTRMLCLDTMDWSVAAVNAAVLVGVTTVGWWLALRSLAARLAS